MSVFHLHSAALADYRDFLRPFFTVADQRVRDFVEWCGYVDMGSRLVCCISDAGFPRTIAATEG